VVKTAWFMVVMVASLLAASAPVVVAAGDVAVALWLEASLGCLRCGGLRDHFRHYAFRSSLLDIPLVSVLRSLVIACKLPLPPQCCSTVLAQVLRNRAWTGLLSYSPLCSG
jgi:hypothetical protein